ncbi:MAG: restriction endonuclease subunit S [Chloroflexi bacterium]|nr:restriction endonuclease subunit S [Chloroflexota bacterium]
MAGEWESVRLGDVCDKIGSGATPRGGNESYQPSGISLIRSQNVFNEGFRRDGLAFIDELQARDLQNVTVQPRDVLLNITGESVARCCQVPDDVLPARVNQHVSIIRPKAGALDARYLRYHLIAPVMQSRMLALSSAGATRKALTKGMIESFEIIAPPLPEQRAIAHILGTLDDKIELNRRMNETLEAMARALFKSWFVDFDPVRAKGRGDPGGRPPGERPSGQARHGMPSGQAQVGGHAQGVPLPGDLAALFPDRLVESELGEIPEGWEVKPLDQMADFLNGLALQKYPPEGDDSLPVIKIAELRRGVTSLSDRASVNLPPEYIVRDGDVLFSWSGSLEVVLWSGGNGALNQHLFKVTSRWYPKWLYFQWIKHHLPDFRAIAAGKATTMGHIQRHHLSDALVALPRSELLGCMDAVMSPLFERQLVNSVQSRTLATIRDALLPKLISGHLRVSGSSGLV